MMFSQTRFGPFLVELIFKMEEYIQINSIRLKLVPLIQSTTDVTICLNLSKEVRVDEE